MEDDWDVLSDTDCYKFNYWEVIVLFGKGFINEVLILPPPDDFTKEPDCKKK